MRGEGILSWKQGIALALGGLLLIFSWMAVFGFLDVFVVEFLLIPYDVPSEARPSPETWQRQLNDFFERPPWRHLPALLGVGFSVSLFFFHIRASKPGAACLRLALILAPIFALSNFLLIMASFFSTSIVDSLLPLLPSLNPIHHIDPTSGAPVRYIPELGGRYAHTYKFLLADTLLVALWLALQAWGIPKLIRFR
jgi:hypothetical protein